MYYAEGELPEQVPTMNTNVNQYYEVKQELQRRQSDYTVFKDITVYCATWNVNNRALCEDSLQTWLNAISELPDIYAIGLQELDTSAKALTFGENRPDVSWINKMHQGMDLTGGYEELVSVRLVGMMLTIFVRNTLRPHIVRYHTKTVARGVFNTLGNKGGVAVSLQINDTNLCFVNSHLAAQMNFVEARNEDYKSIAKNLVFDDERHRSINDHDQIFWLGDLNYRLENVSPEFLATCSNDKEYEPLMPFDQLWQEIRKGNIFEGYKEAAIRFQPTYKYDLGTDNYDSSEKQRAPAYCDRVLWKGQHITQLLYGSIMHMRHSDHKPVYAVFTVKIKSRDEKLYKQVHEEVLKLFDKRENDNQPQIFVEKTVLDFGVVSFNELATQSFTITNICPKPVDFLFKVKDPPLNNICEPWVQLSPSTGRLSIGEERQINVKLLIDATSVRGLLKKIRTVYWKSDFDILILHVLNGPDVFITVTGEYKPSCFGLSTETLCRIDKPLCEYKQADIINIMNDTSSSYQVQLPREIHFLIDYLHLRKAEIKGALTTRSNFNINSPKLNLIRDWLDSWSREKFPGDIHSCIEALLLLLGLPEPCLLEPYAEELLQISSISEAMDIISQLSTPKYNLFMYICTFLQHTIRMGYFEPEKVGETFGSIFFYGYALPSDAPQDSRHHDFIRRITSSSYEFVFRQTS